MATFPDQKTTQKNVLDCAIVCGLGSLHGRWENVEYKITFFSFSSFFGKQIIDRFSRDGGSEEEKRSSTAYYNNNALTSKAVSMMMYGK